jgi:hypothetical protein
VAESDDPVLDVLAVYDTIVGEYFARSDTELLLVTGLSQTPFDEVQFYYRLQHHEVFLKNVGIKFSAVHPRMTRDFLVEFNTVDDAHKAKIILESIKIEGSLLPLFGEIENRGDSLFVTLTYPREISLKTEYITTEGTRKLMPEVSFVAIKNGMHDAKGFAFYTSGLSKYMPTDMSHVSKIGSAILNYFK